MTEPLPILIPAPDWAEWRRLLAIRMDPGECRRLVRELERRMRRVRREGKRG